jgi:hypothetical protein
MYLSSPLSARKGCIMTEYDEPIIDNSAIELNSEFTSGELIDLGLDEIAYIKPIVDGGKNVFGIFAADGEKIGLAPGFKLACAITIQNDLYPVNVH